jgi:hypothetical protein
MLQSPLRNRLNRNYSPDSGGTPNPVVPPTKPAGVGRAAARVIGEWVPATFPALKLSLVEYSLIEDAR